MENLRPNQQRANNAVILIWICLIAAIFSLISEYMQYNLISDFANGGNLSMEDAESNDSRQTLIGIIYFIANIIYIVTFIMWFRRAYYNLHQKAGHRLEYSEGWAAGAWFVPIVNLYRPYQIMKALYEETKRLFVQNDIKADYNLSVNFIGWWWGLWIISNVVGNIVLRFYVRADTVDEILTGTTISMISSIFEIILAVVTIKVIKDYSSVEHLLNKITIPESQNNINSAGSTH
ncbi:MAG: DUF4328 domain-containing protein [Prevotellaceae bacterium]|jgi:biotin transporter BioY|nr:DUF4328 domain-containing protein [Prevotellaceae bacterium]